MKRLLCALLAVGLLWGGEALAAERVTLRFQETGGGLHLTLEGADSALSALQIDLTVEGECSAARFTPDARDIYAPDCRIEAGRGETVVTIYLVAEEEPLSGKSLDLGTLSLEGGGGTPSRAELLLLDRNLEPIEGGSFRAALSGGGTVGGAVGPYRVHILQPEHGAVTVRPTGAKEGETVTLNALPDAGYILSSITVRDGRGREVPLTRDGLNRCTFPMPAEDVEVSASFSPGGGLAFLDVLPGDWCYDAVRSVFEAGLMNGTSATAFTPNASTTRGQIVAILYRLEGAPAAGAGRFSDVAPGAYYAAAVSWASDNGVVNGYADGTFRPDNQITREQMAAFLYRYAVLKGRDVSGEAALDGFADAGQTAAYAVTPLRWATAAGLINGVSADHLNPGGTATRAQVAVILSRFVQNVF